MKEKELIDRLEFIEYRQQLLFENNSYTRLLFEYDVTEDQSNRIYGLLAEYREKIDNGEDVNSGSFEQSIYEITPQVEGDYHFAEFVTKVNHERGSYEEVFETLYGDEVKFQGYMKKKQ